MILQIVSFKHFENVFEHFLNSSLPSNVSMKFSTFSRLFSNWWSSSCKFSIIGIIFSLVVELLEKVLVFFLKQELVYSHLLKNGLLCVFNKQIKFFVAEKNSALHITVLSKYYQYFPIISKGYHYVITLGIFSNFYISIDLAYSGYETS